MRRPVRPDWRGICAAVLGILLMVYGLFRGESKVVLEKAINICMECIGIG